MKSFDIRDSLPAGTTVLEASAGTGKTYTVGALAARFVAEGHCTLDQMLVVTFGRVASQELRERVRDQLVAVQRGLADPLTARASDDTVVQFLAATDDAEAAIRHRRISTALAHFDSATIATTHQFCQQVLVGLGVAGDSEAGATLVENLDDVVAEVVDDLFVRKFARRDAEEPIFTHAAARQLGLDAIRDPQARLEPLDAEPGSSAHLRLRFAQAVRLEVDRRKRRRGLLGYDDLLSRLAGSLKPSDAAARDRMRSRWSVVLVDEFQDTDPVQWDVLRYAFAGHATLILIGDPKQAIYAFRGGDVFTYLAAARTADNHATLSENWRSDAPLVAGLQALMGGAELGDEQIVVRPVTAVHLEARLAGAPSSAPLRLRVVRRDQLGIGQRSKIDMRTVRSLVARDLAADIVRLLAAGPRFAGEPLVAGDVAVLVGTHDQSALVRDALAAAGVPSVVAGAGSVYATQAGEDWLVLLEALEQPHRSGRVRAAALTPFLGRSATELGTAGDELTDELGATLRSWATLLAERGVAALLEVATIEQQLPARLLALQDGARRLTDLRHVGEGLQAAVLQDGLGLTALVEWLRRRRADAVADQATDRTRRLDSDAAAVQVVTLHASKGLQFPVVYVPFAFDRWVPRPDVLLLHDNAGDRVLDVGGQGSSGRVDRQRRAATEQAGEALRLLYVGLTRAQSQVVMWWAPSTNTPDSGLHRLIFGRAAGSPTVAEQATIPSDDRAAVELAALAARGGPAIEPAVPVPAPTGPVPPRDRRDLDCGRFDRMVDTTWRRTSFTALSAAAGDHSSGGGGGGGAYGGGGGAYGGVSSEPEDGERVDESIEPPVPLGSPDAGLLAVPSPMADLPTGTSFGTLVHAVLETTDPTAPDLLAELGLRSAEQLARRPIGLSAEQLAAALLPVLATPMGPLADGLALRDIPVGDRLTELEFEIPLAGGDAVRRGHSGAHGGIRADGGAGAVGGAWMTGGAALGGGAGLDAGAGLGTGAGLGDGAGLDAGAGFGVGAGLGGGEGLGVGAGLDTGAGLDAGARVGGDPWVDAGAGLGGPGATGYPTRVTLGDLGDVLRRRVAPDDPLAGYVRRLSSTGMSWQTLRGYLTGSLDAVFRLPGPRYVVADYKTNWLGEVPGNGAPSGPTPASSGSAPDSLHRPGIGPAALAGSADVTGEPLSAWHYRPDALARTMAGSDYPLQAMLYCVALHRFLRWRQPGYDPDRHLGGVLYLFVRGMCGEANPSVAGLPCGVFGWQPPSGLVVELSDLLDQGPA